MTRVNCIDPDLLLDEWLDAHLREGLRPINNIKNGKDSLDNCPDDWKLGTGHEIFLRKHSIFTLNQWLKAREAYYNRDIKHKDYNYNPTVTGLDQKFQHDYIPTLKAKRSNIARLIVRWKKRKKGKRKVTYHWHGRVIDDYESFKRYIAHVKERSLVYSTLKH